MKSHVAKLKAKKNLTPAEMREAMGAIMSGSALKEDMASFLLALRAKGPSVEEITAAAEMMRQFSLKVATRHKIFLDTCGTGGDRKDTFNISTLVALVVAGAGVVVAKHGNRSVSSKCGSADILEALGVNLNLDNIQLGNCLDEIGIAFLFAQKLHPAMKHAAPVRKELGVETIFNLLGPLTNPASATHQMMGVYDKKFVVPLVHVLKNLGAKRAMVVHGEDGLDEITTTGPSVVGEFNGREILSYTVLPGELGIKIVKPDALKGGDLDTNARIAREVLDGKKGPARDIVLLNAAYALLVAQKATTPREGLALAASTLDTGKAREKLEQLKRFTNKI